MSKSLFEEAITDARQLRESAEQNAKNVIIEAVTPKIREFIESQLVGNQHETGDFLEEALIDETDKEAEVELDESALKMLSQIFNSKNSKNSNDINLQEAFGALSEDEQMKLMSMIKEVDNDNILNNIEETEILEKNTNIYEIDLNDLRTAITNETSQSNATKRLKMKNRLNEEEKLDLSDLMNEAEDEDEEVEEDTTEEEVEESAPAGKKFVLKLPFDIDELVAGATLSGMLEADDSDDGEVSMPEEEMPEEEMPEEEMPGDEQMTEQMYEIDENMLRGELSRLREARSKKSKATKLPQSVAASFGGGTAEKFAHEIKMNELDLVNKKALKESQDNRELRVQLNEYRSAVQALREQMSDLNLFNAKLLYVNKILQVKSVTPTQRRSIIEALDGAKTLRETKLLYESLTASLETSNKTVNESAISRFSAGGASRPTTSTSVRISEAAEVDRWSLLAGIK